LSNAAGETIEQVVVDAPIAAMRDFCRAALNAAPQAVRGRLLSTDGLLDDTHPEDRD